MRETLIHCEKILPLIPAANPAAQPAAALLTQSSLFRMLAVVARVTANIPPISADCMERKVKVIYCLDCYTNALFSLPKCAIDPPALVSTPDAPTPSVCSEFCRAATTKPMPAKAKPAFSPSLTGSLA